MDHFAPVLKKRLQPEDAAKLHAAIHKAAAARTRHFLGGINAYRHHPASRDRPSVPVIWQCGTTCLRDYGAANPNGATVLVIPSLINRFDILDLDTDHSFLNYLAEQGLRPLVVDWDSPSLEEQNFSISDYVTRRLLPIMDFLNTKTHIIGYCMGGLLAMALPLMRPEQTASLSLMATPWDFAGNANRFSALLKNLEPCLDTLGHLPVTILQSLFMATQPLQMGRKYIRFAQLNQDSPQARRFVLTEDWLNDGVPLTANVARECLRDWYRDNKTAALQWRVDGTVIDPTKIKVPTYIVVPTNDVIVPPESALPLATHIPHATLHQPVMGHVGLMASHRAPDEVWGRVVRWLGYL